MPKIICQQLHYDSEFMTSKKITNNYSEHQQNLVFYCYKKTHFITSKNSFN